MTARERFGRGAAPWLAAVAVAAVMVGLRAAVDPWLGPRQPLATMYGAVAIAVWLGGWRPAALTMALGYMACDYLFIEPRGGIGLRSRGDAAGLAVYVISALMIIAFGEALRRADARARAAEAALRKSEAAQRLLVDIGDAVRDLDDPVEVKARTCALVAAHFAVARCVYVEVDAAGEYAFVEGEFARGVSPMAGRHRVGPNVPALGRAWQAGQAVAVDDILLDARTREPAQARFLAGFGTRALLGVPLLQEGRLASLFALHHDAPRPWSVDDVALARQVAERMRVSVERARAVAGLRENDRRKDEFLATLAHELRNPLAPIQTAVEIFRRIEPSHSLLLEPRDIIDRQVRHLTRLVDDLLDASRITQGKVNLRRERLDARAAARAAVELARPAIDAGRHAFEARMPDAPLWIDADPTRITQVVANLLNNAAKYTPQGGRIELEAALDVGDVVIRVTDTGLGIEPDQVSHLFRIFSQLPGRGDGRGGLGIGLALVKAFVELHGGRVAVESDGAGRGSRFEVRLPRAPGD